MPMTLIKRIQNVTQWSLNYRCIIFQTLHCVTCVSNHVVCCAKNISECQILFPPLTSVYPGVLTCVHLPPADSGIGESKTNLDSAENKREVLPMQNLHKSISKPFMGAGGGLDVISSSGTDAELCLGSSWYQGGT